uniref:Nudix hydrolase domain-containing protein n=1 Tax=Heterorhabditis bacteriophora TaxID=37862 RepID=A0A1I7WIS2_HETBA
MVDIEDGFELGRYSDISKNEVQVKIRGFKLHIYTNIAKCYVICANLATLENCIRPFCAPYLGAWGRDIDMVTIIVCDDIIFNNLGWMVHIFSILTGYSVTCIYIYIYLFICLFICIEVSKFYMLSELLEKTEITSTLQKEETASYHMLAQWKEREGPRERLRDKDGYRIRAAGVCVTGSGKDTMVLLVSGGKEGGKWVVPGGGVEQNECPEEAARRELEEEAGVKARTIEVIGLFQVRNLIIFTSVHNDVPLCGPGIFELLEDSSKLSFSSSMKDHVVALPTVNEQINITIFENNTGVFQPIRCFLRLETCPNCILNIKYRSPTEIISEQNLKMVGICRFFFNFVFKYHAATSLSLIHVLIYYLSKKEQILHSIYSTRKHLFGIFHSGFKIFFINIVFEYPYAYPRSLEKKYSLINQDQKGFVRLIFDDFQVHFQSELQIFDSDGLELINTRKSNRRPPAIISSGNQLIVEFKAHDFTQVVGFRARYEFVDDQNWPQKPNSRESDCDGFLEGYGGEIKMDENIHVLNTYVDCIWIIGRLPHMAQTFDKIYLKAEDFRLKGVDLNLEIREGASSVSDRVLLLFNSQTRNQLEHKQPRHGFTTGLTMPAFYIRLRGYLMSTNGLKIVYSHFYHWATSLCPDIDEFHCDNARCIKANLRCDDVNHCGDLSDEQCQRPLNEFKQSGTDLSGVLALLLGICGLIILLISTTVVMGRFYRRRINTQFRANESSYSPNSFSSDVIPTIQTVGERRFYVVPENQISVIEAPPSYSDALKHPAVPSLQRSGYANQGFTRISENPPGLKM